jgi:nucleoside-diphosphate-sugar epimerase
MKILVTGATGTVGGDLIREATKYEQVDFIVALSRKPLEISDKKLRVVLHQDYLNYESIESEFKNIDWVIWCLGISQSQVSKEEYIKITFDYTIKAADFLRKVNPSAGFIFVSGEGANEEGKATTLFGKIKGKVETYLLTMKFTNLYIVRPGGIRPIHMNKNTAMVNKIMAPLYPLVELIAPSTMIRSDDLGKAILYLAAFGTDHPIIKNKELRALSKIK